MCALCSTSKPSNRKLGLSQPKTFLAMRKITMDFVGRLPGGNTYFFVVVDLSDSVRWQFCTRSMRWPNSAFKIFESNAVFIKKMLQSSIIVHRALSLICLLCMPMWSLTRAIEKADPVSLGILNMPIIVLIHICLSPGSS